MASRRLRMKIAPKVFARASTPITNESIICSQNQNTPDISSGESSHEVLSNQDIANGTSSSDVSRGNGEQSVAMVTSPSSDQQSCIEEQIIQSELPSAENPPSIEVECIASNTEFTSEPCSTRQELDKPILVSLDECIPGGGNRSIEVRRVSDGEIETLKTRTPNNEEIASAPGCTNEEIKILQKLRKSTINIYNRKSRSIVKSWNKEFIAKNNDDADRELILRDYIFYNPDTNPLERSRRHLPEIEIEDSELVDDVENEAISVPQLVVGSDGEIVIDPSSLVISATQRVPKLHSGVTHADDHDGRYRLHKPIARRRWTLEETGKFYKALSVVGTDFTLMNTLFPNRKRDDLKRKFNHEDKINPSLVQKALTDSFHFDPESISDVFEEDSLYEEAKEEINSRENSKRRKRSTKLVSETSVKKLSKRKENTGTLRRSKRLENLSK